MSLYVTKGNPLWKKGIPRNSHVRLEVMPHRRAIFDGDVSGTFSHDLDPGFYHITITKYLGKNAQGRNSGLRWDQEFLFELSKDEFLALSNMAASNVKARMTSEGLRLFCQWPGCEHDTTNHFSAVLHDCEHRGISREDLVKNSEIVLSERADSETNKDALLPNESREKKGRSFSASRTGA